MTERNFTDLLHAQWQTGHVISVGLDPEVERLPAELRKCSPEDGVVEFLRRVIVATATDAGAYKPNAAHFEALGPNGFAVLRTIVQMVNDLAPNTPVIFDAKRADIGNTNEKYAEATFDHLGADAITVHPYLGPEAMRPFLERKNNGVIVLARTSNPGAGRYQDLQTEGMPLYQYIARDVAEHWNTYGNCGLVVGATYPDEMKKVRAVAPNLPILVPGIGAQGGDITATIENGMLPDGSGLLLHAGRSLLYAFENGGTVQEATAGAMQALMDEIAAAR
jgi:orotidine-5'-phosphate decarboxylase